MCGIVGFWEASNSDSAVACQYAEKMANTIAHRGPDDDGIWHDQQESLVLTHRRLSILDLSPAGRQPMHSQSERFVIIFNGEIYNHLELREKLQDSGKDSWRGHSDTETLLEAIETWGLEEALRNCVGMFALALWDRKEKVLSLARDRLGEKPLYYGWQNQTLLFGSELKALRVHPAFRAEINQEVLPLYFRHGYIPAPWSVWKGILKLKPGSIVSFDGTKQVGHSPDPKRYWSMTEVIENGQNDPFGGSEEEAADLLEEQLLNAVEGQMLADVPVGAFLSGGIDSSLVVALMQARSSNPVKTFSIGFDEEDFNEAENAKAVSSHLGTDHTELYVTPEQAREVVAKLPNLYDEPFGDSSAIPTFLVSELARRKVAVSLSGDGGDELFGGYDRYFNHKAESLWRRLNQFPQALRNFSAFGLQSLLGNSPSGKAELLYELLKCKDFGSYYRVMISQWRKPPVLGSVQELEYGIFNDQLDALDQSAHKMMGMDSVTYLPDDILVKVDRAAMAVSLETRVPLLDHRVVELAWRMPYDLKVRDGRGKWLLRQVLYRHVPRKLIDRPKKGFGVPVDSWIRGPLRNWAEDLLSEEKLQETGFLNPRPIRARWKQHLEGKRNWRDSLWLVLMWQAWAACN
jgi:asparagine synthase (glutamine-hydrolysing)